MRFRSTVVVIIIVTFTMQTGLEARNMLWSEGTAHLLPPGQKEMGFFQPFRYGYSGTLEISTYKLSTLIIPNISVKRAWNSYKSWDLATRHGLVYPTLLLRKLQSPLGMKLGDPDKFALISPEFKIPQMIALHNGILASRILRNGQLLTIKGSLDLAFLGGKLDRRTTIDLPLIFPRLSVFYNKLLFRFGSDLAGSLTERWSYLLDYDLFLMPGGHEFYILEHKGLLIWTKSDRFRVLAGYKLSAGEYPFGVQAHLLPALDFQWGF